MAFVEHCVTCPYYSSAVSVTSGYRMSYTGICCRYALYGQGDKFPSVSELDWCGEHPKNSLPVGLIEMELEDPTHNVITGFATKNYQKGV